MPREAWLLRPAGPVPYGPANEAMHRLAERRLLGQIPDTVVLLEHPPVFTAGRRARPEELVWSAEELNARGAEVHRVDRGGRSRSTDRGSWWATPSSTSGLGRTPQATCGGWRRS